MSFYRVHETAKQSRNQTEPNQMKRNRNQRNVTKHYPKTENQL